jgi:NADP-dependent 3-hydroxy acid dehydrogenase YdfG
MTKTVLITGASSGIGAAAALALSSEWHVVLVARRVDRLEVLATQLKSLNRQVSVIPADITASGAPQRVVDLAVKLAGRLDALVNNAGVFSLSPVSAIDQAHLDAIWSLNVTAPILMASAAIPHLAKHGGSIINVSSVAVESTFSGCAAYTASKAALEAWSRIAREELRAQRIRVGVVAPGATDTEVWPADSQFDRSRMSPAADVAAAISAMLAMPAGTSIDRLVVTPVGGAL